MYGVFFERKKHLIRCVCRLMEIGSEQEDEKLALNYVYVFQTYIFAYEMLQNGQSFMVKWRSLLARKI